MLELGVGSEVSRRGMSSDFACDGGVRAIQVEEKMLRG